jgi:hypothetical protein
MPYVTIHRRQQCFSQLLRSFRDCNPDDCPNKHSGTIYLLSPEYRGSYSNFEGSSGASSFWEELEGNRAGTVAVQAIACTDKVRQDVDVAGWPIARRR